MIQMLKVDHGVVYEKFCEIDLSTWQEQDGFSIKTPIWVQTKRLCLSKYVPKLEPL